MLDISTEQLTCKLKLLHKMSTIQIALSQIKPRHFLFHVRVLLPTTHPFCSNLHRIFKRAILDLKTDQCNKKIIICGGTIRWPLPYKHKEIYKKL